MNDDELSRVLNAAEHSDARSSNSNESRTESACPDSDEMWALCSGELNPPRLQAILEHATTCETCRESLQAARRAVGGVGDDAVKSSSAWRRFLPAAMAIAAILVVAVALTLSRDRFGVAPLSTAPKPSAPAQSVPIQSAPTSTATNRGDPLAAEWIDLVDGDSLPRSAFELRWQRIDGATGYVVELFSADLDVLGRSATLQEPFYLVQPSELVQIEAADAVLWRVEARLSTGELLRSPVFRTEVAP